MSLDLSLHLPRSGFALDVDLQLPEQGVSVLWGASGSGKSSVLRCVAGLERAHGHVRLGPTVWQDDARGLWVPPWERRIGLVFQDAHLFEHLDVRGNLHYGLRRLPKAEQPAATAALHDALAVLGLQGLLDRRTATLSGGEQARLLLAREFARHSNLLVLDEPTNDLDLETLDLLQEVIADYDGTVLIVSHDRDFLDRTVTLTLGLDGSGKVDIVAGGYADWEKRRSPPKVVSAKPKTSADAPEKPRLQTKLSYKDQRDYDLLPARVEELGAAIADAETKLSDPDLYTQNPARFADLTKEIERLRAERDAAEERWLTLAEMVETLGG